MLDRGASGELVLARLGVEWLAAGSVKNWVSQGSVAPGGEGEPLARRRALVVTCPSDLGGIIGGLNRPIILFSVQLG